MSSFNYQDNYIQCTAIQGECQHTKNSLEAEMTQRLFIFSLADRCVNHN